MKLKEEISLLEQKLELLKQIKEIQEQLKDIQIPTRMQDVDPVIRDHMMCPSCTPLS